MVNSARIDFGCRIKCSGLVTCIKGLCWEAEKSKPCPFHFLPSLSPLVSWCGPRN